MNESTSNEAVRIKKLAFKSRQPNSISSSLLYLSKIIKFKHTKTNDN